MHKKLIVITLLGFHSPTNLQSGQVKDQRIQRRTVDTIQGTGVCVCMCVHDIMAAYMYFWMQKEIFLEDLVTLPHGKFDQIKDACNIFYNLFLYCLMWKNKKSCTFVFATTGS